MIKRITFDEQGNILEIEFGDTGITLERINQVLQTLGLRVKTPDDRN